MPLKVCEIVDFANLFWNDFTRKNVAISNMVYSILAVVSATACNYRGCVHTAIVCKHVYFYFVIKYLVLRINLINLDRPSRSPWGANTCWV
jgi:hypothetical protein